MAAKIKIALHQVSEHIKFGGLKNALKKTVYHKRSIIPVVKNLAVVPDNSERIANAGLTFYELTKERYYADEYEFSIPSRKLKIEQHIENGCGIFIVVSGKRVVGTIFYATSDNSNHPTMHEDMDLLFIKPEPDDVYLFDMFVDPSERGKNIAFLLMSSSLRWLRVKGYKRAIGYFEEKNIPALWVHRQLKFRELDRIYFSRCFFRRTSHRGNSR